MDRSVHDEDVEHLRAIGQLDEYTKSHGYHWGKSVDFDTFFSISISILAARLGLNVERELVREAVALFGDDIAGLAEQLVPQRLCASVQDWSKSDPARSSGLLHSVS